MNRDVFLILFFSLVICSFVNAAEINSYVVDNANVFDSDIKADLIENLKQFEIENNGTQIVIFTERRIPQGSTLEERSLNLAETAGVGTKQDNGLLFYLAVDDRQYRWEVGYGLEPVLNSAWLGRMSRAYMDPDFKQGTYSLGILKGLEQVELQISGPADTDSITVTSSYKPNYSNSSYFSLFTSGPLLIFIILFIIMTAMKFFLRKTADSTTNDGVFIGAASNMFHGSSGGFGGFSGGFQGGGGSFGGGGFSGRF